VLFEMKRSSATPPFKDRGVTGSSASSLHAKTFSVDRSHVFIGSFNFDPRSARLNTELGFVIDSPRLAEAGADLFAFEVPGRAYEVGLSGSGALQWVERVDGGTIVHRREPGVSVWLRLAVWTLSKLPIEWLL
jgi:putative cardiolipin synthase